MSIETPFGRAGPTFPLEIDYPLNIGNLQPGCRHPTDILQNYKYLRHLWEKVDAQRPGFEPRTSRVSFEYHEMRVVRGSNLRPLRINFYQNHGGKYLFSQKTI